jgi:hypothetical protein
VARNGGLYFAQRRDELAHAHLSFRGEQGKDVPARCVRNYVQVRVHAFNIYRLLYKAFRIG